ncbi:MAG TPA: NAD(P)H-binding protein [Kutzneria sp.]|jgi:uncharacterized protein YbjT (DUF2867 family)
MIVVTTPTGAIGSKLVRNLLDHDAEVRVIVRDPARLPDDVRERVDVVVGPHSDREVVDKAFAGADALFWLVPPNYRAESLDAAYLDFTRPATEALVAQGVQRVVSVSALGRGTPWADRAGLVTAALNMDDLIAATGVRFRALALPSFMENVLRQKETILTEGVLRDPLDATAKYPTACTADFAAAAARLLLDDTWTGQGSLAVLGPEDLSGNDKAAILTEVLGRPVRYEQVQPDAFRAGLDGLSEAMIQGFYDMMIAKRNGLDNAEPRTPETASPTSFRDWAAKAF